MASRRDFMVLAALGAAVPRHVLAEAAYPAHAVKMVVPLPPGGSPDYTARLVSDRLQAVLGQPFVVDNKPGANGGIAREFTARSTPDGYTLLMTESSHVMSAALVKSPYDPIRDFEPIVQAVNTPFVLAVNSSLGVGTLDELIALARAKPGQLNYGSSGVGAPHHFAAELLRSMTGIDVVHVPYKGSAAIIPALLANEIAFTIGGINSLLPHFRSGRLKALAVASAQRTQVMPELPTIAEAGPLPGYAVDIWVGLVGPAGLPRSVVDRLNAEVNKLVRDPAFARDKLLAVGLDPLGGTPAEFGAIMKADLQKYATIAKAAGMKVE
jgi:tripartite-type tricarboxylate transporter receptor subunit TctC